jgi:hypothetical protein
MPTSQNPLAPTSVSVGTKSQQIVAANVHRTGLTLENMSGNDISIAFGQHPAVLYSGITLFPRDAFCMDAFLFTTEAVNAIASNASSNIAIQEWN